VQHLGLHATGPGAVGMKIDWWPPECLDRSHECVCRDSVVRPSPLDCFCVRPGTDEIGEGCRRGLFHPRSEILACSRGNPPPGEILWKISWQNLVDPSAFKARRGSCQYSWSSRCTAQSYRAGFGLNARRMMSGESL